MNLTQHLPVLQILIPFIAAMLATVSFNKHASWFIATIAATISFAFAIYTYMHLNSLDVASISYEFGNWQSNIGIEYKLDKLNQSVIIYINFVLSFFLLFGKNFIESKILGSTDKSRSHLFYTILLLVHLGHLGVISTNDMFNMYVFIEISSLATYVLMSKGDSAKALTGAFDYLILGTLGATLILISIGFFLSVTGSLNISDIHSILSTEPSIYNSKLIITAIVFFLSGVILKMAFFPMHFWMVRAYSFASTYMLVYLAAISTIIGTYIFIRFMHFTIDGSMMYNIFIATIRPVAVFTIIICTIFALYENNIKHIIIYSAASQIGYVFLLLTIESAKHILFYFLMLDGVNKMGLFLTLTNIQSSGGAMTIYNFKQIKKSYLFKTLTALILIFSCGLPLTSMFLIKVNILSSLLKQNLVTEFAVVIFGSIMALLYHFKIGKTVFFSFQKTEQNNKSDNSITISNKLSGMLFIVTIQAMTLIFYNKNMLMMHDIQNLL